MLILIDLLQLQDAHTGLILVLLDALLQVSVNTDVSPNSSDLKEQTLEEDILSYLALHGFLELEKSGHIQTRLELQTSE